MEEIKTEQDIQETEAILPEEPAEEQAAAQPEAAPVGRDYAAEVRGLYEARPELRGTELPGEVIAACVGGKSLTAAYADYARRQHQEARQARTPRRPAVKSVTQGGSVTREPEDAFLRGFNTGW